MKSLTGKGSGRLQLFGFLYASRIIPFTTDR